MTHTLQAQTRPNAEWRSLVQSLARVMAKSMLTSPALLTPEPNAPGQIKVRQPSRLVGPSWLRARRHGIPVPPGSEEHRLSITTETSTEPTSRPIPPGIEALTYRLADLPRALGVSRRTIEGERAAGRFPRPDLKMGRIPLWRRQTIDRWLAQGGGKP